MAAASSSWRAVPKLAAFGAALVMLAVACGPLLPHSNGGSIVKIAVPAQAKHVRASTRSGAGLAKSAAPQSARRVASHALHTEKSSTATGASAAEPPPPAAKVAAVQAPAEEVHVQAPGPPPEPRPHAAPAPAPEQLRSRVAAFQERLATDRPALEQAWGERLTGLRPRGIVVAAGHPTLLANAYVGLFVLRHSLGCTLPIMIMYWGNVTSDLPTQETIAYMQEQIPGLELVDASQLHYPSWQTPLAATPDKWNGWKLKAFAVYAAPFEEVLFLDSDATPVLDPQLLFEHPAFRVAGSMFWPDIWCGDVDLFRALRMPSIGVGERQTESGVFLIDRRRHWLALEWLLWLNVEDDVTYKLAYGDKDTFRAAFFLAGRLSHFYQVSFPLGLMLNREGDQLRMRGFMQAHPNGTAAFLHRVSGSKFNLYEEDPRLISHLTLPSCTYFHQRGWHPDVVPSQHFAPGIRASAAPAAEASGPAGDECPYDMHTLYDASRRCARYNYNSASGNQQLPLFEVPAESHVGRVIADSAAAFRLLRQEMAQRGSDSQLFQASAQPAAS